MAVPQAQPLSSFELMRRFLRDRRDPVFEMELVRRAVSTLPPLHGSRVLDVGCGPGFHANAMASQGATVAALELVPSELHRAGRPPRGGTVGDAGELPFAEGVFDGVLCSNMLEHTPRPLAALDEMARVLMPGGWAYVSWTNWYSPWGGHAIAPFHYLGPSRGTKVYKSLFGPPKGTNLPFDGVWPLHITTVLDHLGSPDSGWAVRSVEPRYYPWLRGVMKIRGVREVVAWNCLIRMERAPTLPRQARLGRS